MTMHTDLIALIKSRRSVRSFQLDQPVSPKHVTQILEAGIWAPTGTNQQEIRFAVIQKYDLLEAFALYKHIKSPLVIVLFADMEAFYSSYPKSVRRQRHKRPLPHVDSGLAMMNMMLVAESLGLKSVPLNTSRFLFYETQKGSGLWKRLLKQFAIRTRTSCLGIRFFDHFVRQLDIDTNRFLPTGALAIGHSDTQPKTEGARYGGNPVQRSELEHYVLGRYA